MTIPILIRGGGDLASGVALRLRRAGFKVLITELPQPLAVRRTVSFAEAVYEGEMEIEGIKAKLVRREQVQAALDADEIPVLVDPDVAILTEMKFNVVVDARLTKQAPTPLPVPVPLHIGLGPGFHAGWDCHAVVETCRGHTLGRVYWDGSARLDSGWPEGDLGRVLRAVVAGRLIGYAHIGDHLEEGQVIAEILPSVILSEAKTPQTQSDMAKITSPFPGVLRGLIRPGLHVTAGLKIGDVDPRDDREACFLVSDKALAIGGAVLEAILSKVNIRKKLWD